ncbi:alpha-L-arabinofuranosidase [Actinoalloteichus sp. AHMU CJ021]|uniref:non-reducing end alpha-L-arabinofuranosidase n=1 Tax=Actinoalloteichus caeruleus DSM 43889 TaxID=1120930 RepID=A0ABT1JQ15_ACTCY|nr:alpha-N-arabinofuranosidase [Actinoalloteichus caeruleus]AUS80367.1 alpha-L-arabinofuranosidase [Actinoalloteichus sp. AHMU CJ021]MCP2334627.1 alpha-N-arabinofuranosidase [Actinoalloteichus caeruleus DSM 43889]
MQDSATPEQPTASLTLDPAFSVGEVNPRLFGSFVEHMGRCVYTGIYEPDHPTADADGLRTDVLALIRELGVTMVRYPGGNFVSGYNWEDGVGPVEERPRRLEPAWKSTETNQFGLSEFMNFTRKTGIEPMMALNLGTRGVDDARRLLEYTNHPGGTELSDLRRRHGDEEPFDIRLWCLGNELDGPWQMGHKSAEEYGRLANETANVMRLIDPDLRLVACGSSSSAMSTFASWEATMLEHCYDRVDYVSCHAYYHERDGDVGSFLASAVDMEHFIESVVATADHVRARVRSSKRLEISFDEWNVWYQSREGEDPGWRVAPRVIEDVYSVTDAVVVGSLLITLLRHCDRVTAACLAQLVNVIAPIMTEPGGPAWRQASFFPFADAARHGRGRVLRLAGTSTTYETAKFGEVDHLHATAVEAEDGGLTVFAVNRDTEKPLRLTADLRGLGKARVLEHRVLADEDRHATNTLENQERVAPRQVSGTSCQDGTLTAELPPLSWNVIRVAAN